MKGHRIMMIGAMAAAGLLTAGNARAEGAGFSSHYLVPQEPYASEAHRMDGDEKLALREYLNYENREPCQGYQKPPEPFVTDGCSRTKTEPTPIVTAEVHMKKTEMHPIMARYTVYFDFDKAGIRPSEQETMEKVAREIDKYRPGEVTIAGYTDRAGPADYNFRLSQMRAQSVSEALTRRGIPNRVLDKEAEGESHPAVPTEDGVKLQQNRRVEIQFRK